MALAVHIEVFKVDLCYAPCQRHVNINVMSGISSSRFYDQIFICPKLKAIETAFATRHDQSVYINMK